MIYLASPYSHDDPSVREIRFQAACQVTAAMICNGHCVFSPIVHGHPLVAHGLPIDWSFWESYGRDHLQRCDAVVVLQLDGWEESTGVSAEIQIATELDKPVWYHDPEAWGDTLACVGKEVAL